MALPKRQIHTGATPEQDPGTRPACRLTFTGTGYSVMVVSGRTVTAFLPPPNDARTE